MKILILPFPISLKSQITKKRSKRRNFLFLFSYLIRAFLKDKEGHLLEKLTFVQV